jgi:pimeloyl-ACP methyl ester carboxylesterase
LCNTRSQPDSDEGRLNRAAAIRKIELEGVAAFVESFMGKLFTPATLAAEGESVSSIREIMLSTPVATYSGGLLAMAARTDTTPSLAKFDKPALLLFAQEDTLMPPSEGEAMAQLLPNAVLHVVPGAAHLSNMENSMEFNRHLIPFLESVTRD